MSRVRSLDDSDESMFDEELTKTDLSPIDSQAKSEKRNFVNHLKDLKLK